MASSLEYLQSLVDPVTGTTLYTIAKVAKVAAPISRPTATFVVPGRNGGLNPRAGRPNPMAPRTYEVSFWHPYGVGETYTTARDTLWRAVGDRYLTLLARMPDGTQRGNRGALTAFPQAYDPTAALAMVEFALTFQLDDPYWRAIRSAGAPPQYDAGIHYDTGVTYDGSLSLALSATTQQIALTNNGDAPVADGRYAISVPRGGTALTGPLTMFNTSVPIGGGQVMQWTYNNSIPAGSTLIVDCGLGAVTRDGVPVWQDFQWGLGGYVQREWMRLDPGVNTIQFNAGAAGSSAVFVPAYYDAFI